MNKPQTPSQNDQRSNVKNSNNADFKANQDNRANQMNPNNQATKGGDTSTGIKGKSL